MSSVFKAFFGLGKIPKVTKYFEFPSFNDVNKMGGAIQAMKNEARISGKKFSPAQIKYLDDQMKQVEMVFEQIKQAPTNSPLPSGIRNTESAKIFNLQGQEIPKGSKIMGGKAVKETEAEIAARLSKENKMSSSRLRKNKMKEELSKVDDQIEEMLESGVDEMDPRLSKLYDKQNDLDLKLDFEELIDPDPTDFADGGVAGLLGERTGFRGGGMDMGNKSNQAQSASMGGGGGGGNARENYRTQQYTTPKTTPRGGEGGTTTPKPKPKVNVKKNISTGSFTPTFNFLKKFVAHDRFTDQLKARRSKNYHELGGLDFMARFPDINPSIAKGLASAYQNIFEYGRAVADGPGGITFEDADKRAKEESRLNAVGIDAFANPDSSLYQEYTDMVPESGAVQMADGGPARQNFAMGKRAFLKLLAGTGAGIAGLKSGLLGLGGKQATKKAVTETVKQTAGPGTPPPYFFKLVEKIKTLGDDVGATQDRQIAKSMKSKDGKSEYFLEEDVTTGDTIIKKISKEDDRLVSKVEIMQHNKGKADELTKGKKPKDTYEEVTEYNSRIYKDNYSPSSYEDGINQEGISEIVEEAGVGFVKKADGGRIGYNIGGLSKLGKIMAGINKKFGKNTMTTADKIVQPEKTIQQRIMEFEARNPKLSEIDKDILIRAKELKLEDNMPYVKNLYRVHRKDKAGIGSLKEFHADFVKETGQNVPIENLRTAWRSKRSYPFNTPVVDKTGKSIGGEATQKMYPESKKFIVEESAESFMKPKIKKTTEREFIDVPPMPKGFKLSREKLEKNYPELDEDMIDQIMDLDKEMQGTVLTMLKNRRQNPGAYDKLLETKGDTLEFQGAFDEVTRKSNNADGGRIGLSTGGLARMLGE